MNIQVLLEKYFDVAFAAPNGVKKLRELILSLAMQGKLVAQDPHDVPASKLLKEIEAEKKRLVKEGKIKQSKPLPEIKPDEVTYNLPKSWEWVRLGDLIHYSIGGGTPSKNNSSFWEGNIPWASVKDLNVNVYLEKTIDSITEEALKKSTSNLVPKNNIIVCTRMGLGKIVINKIDVAINQDLRALILSPLVDQMFFFQKYKSYEIQGTGVTVKGIRLDELLDFIFPLPPLAEQRRIVAKIDELMARCDELEKLRGNLNQKQITVHNAALNRLLTAKDQSDFNTAWQFITQNFGELYSVKKNVTELRKAILQLAVMGKLVPQDPIDRPASELLKEIEKEKQRLVKEGKIKKLKPLPEIKLDEVPYELPKGWKWVRLIDIVDVGTGSTPATTNPDYYNGTIPWYTSSATSNSIANIPETFITEIALKETNCKVFPSGSLIIAMYGQGKTRGQISEIVLAGATNQAIAAMVFYNVSQSIKQYIKYYFIKIYDEIRSTAEGAAQPNLNVGKIKETLIPLPPLAEQHRIVAKCDRLMTLCDNLEKQIDETNSKKTNLLNAVMTKFW